MPWQGGVHPIGKAGGFLPAPSAIFGRQAAEGTIKPLFHPTRYSVSFTRVVLASLPLYGLIFLLITQLSHARLNEKFNRGAENQAFLLEAVSGVDTLKAAASIADGVMPLSDQRIGEAVGASAGRPQAGSLRYRARLHSRPLHMGKRVCGSGEGGGECGRYTISDVGSALAQPILLG
ncbi:MAG: hypothetical protein Q8M09_13190 [Pseudomonadota bacterium]|nr:hypothetical protein [Pseudomonadota bacterium]MDP1905182.1 hypothetical protein [Pseudomonadota bacterium]MDP2353402.1 hypothetical protein [Pseudomonadota bacterium]